MYVKEGILRFSKSESANMDYTLALIIQSGLRTHLDLLDQSPSVPEVYLQEYFNKTSDCLCEAELESTYKYWRGFIESMILAFDMNYVEYIHDLSMEYVTHNTPRSKAEDYNMAVSEIDAIKELRMQFGKFFSHFWV